MLKLLCVLLAFLSSQVMAAEAGPVDSATDKSTSWSSATEISNFDGDFGVGINLASHFFHDHWAVKFAASQSFFKGIPVGRTTEETKNYYCFRLSLVGATLPLSKLVRLYGGGGMAVFLPNSALSDKTTFSGFGGFGFEFFMNQQSTTSFYIEMGGIGGGTAEKLIGSPTYGGGFLSSVGTRHFF